MTSSLGRLVLQTLIGEMSVFELEWANEREMKDNINSLNIVILMNK